MSTLLSITSQDHVDGTPNQFEYKFLGQISFSKSEVCMAYSTMYKSWNNIDPIFTNNTYQLRWCNNEVKTVTMPAGIYSISDINAFLLSFCQSVGWYLVDAAGDPVYYLSWELNPLYYSVGLVAVPVPTEAQAIAANLSKPPSNTWAWQGSAISPQAVISEGSYDSDNFGSIVGFAAGSFPVDRTISTNTLSTFAPTVSPVASVFVNSNFVNNTMSRFPNLLYSISVSDAKAGETIVMNPQEFMWLTAIEGGTFSTAKIWLTDQKGRSLRLRDLSVNLMLLFRKHDL